MSNSFPIRWPKNSDECSAVLEIGDPIGRCSIKLVVDNMAALEAWIVNSRAYSDYTKVAEYAAGLMSDTEDAVWKSNLILASAMNGLDRARSV